ncbi:MAG: hypothetical protein KBT46_00255 [Ruminococcus sp.]|nr:hypothetical protein [Candidatus Copronaster equi]
MRPIRDMILEDTWGIAYRKYTPDDSVVKTDKRYKFQFLKPSKRIYYADPFLFEKDGRLFLFVEMFDELYEKGTIGYSELINGEFTEPVEVLKEDFHLSYPVVFEKDGQIYMMPETRWEHCIQIYRAEHFPDKWVKEKHLVEVDDVVDTILYKDVLFASKITNPAEMETQLELYDYNTGKDYCPNPVSEKNQKLRGAGGIYERNGKIYRPAQDCTGAVYGRGVCLYEVEKLSTDGYSEKLIGEIMPENIDIGEWKPSGLHTYVCTDKIEIVDVKVTRLNIRRTYWIIARKFGLK